MEENTDKLANDPPSAGKLKRRVSIFDVIIVAVAAFVIYYVRRL